MSDTIELNIITTTAPPLKTNIKQIYFQTSRGRTGVLKDHTPYISLVEAGELSYTDAMNRNFFLYIHQGVMEVYEDKITIISDHLEKGDELNPKEITDKIAALDRIIQESTKITEGMSAEEMTKLPDNLAKALKEKREYVTRLEIIQKTLQAAKK